jgi:transposase
MKRFILGRDRTQGILLPEQVIDYVTDESPVRVIEVFVDELDRATLGFQGEAPADTGRPAYHPADLSKPYIFSKTKILARMQQIEESIDPYLSMVDTTDRTEPAEACSTSARLQDPEATAAAAQGSQGAA